MHTIPGVLRGRRIATMLVIAAAVFCGQATVSSTARAQSRQSLEIGSIAQSTDNKITGPYHGVSGPSSYSYLGTRHEQIFAGPFLRYVWSANPHVGIEGRMAYLPGKQPVQDMSGGSVLLAAGGVRVTFGDDCVRFFGRVAPGLVSFSQAGGELTMVGRQTSRLTHFAFDEGAGADVRLFGHTSAEIGAGKILFFEGGEPGSTVGGVRFTLSGDIEDHLTVELGLVQSFGDLHRRADDGGQNTQSQLLNNVVLSYAMQVQPHLAFDGAYLNRDQGTALSGSHAVDRWFGLDTSAIFLPGGDSPNYQDGGAETELLAGLRAGVQRTRYGIFVKFRAGGVSFASTTDDNTVLVPPHVRSWDFASDSGGIFEIYPKRHWIARLDVGEQNTRYHKVSVKEPAPENSATQPATSTNSLLILVGTGWRF